MCTGIGFTGQARILIARHKPTNFFNTVRHINLEVLTSEQLEEIQQEMKLSQLLHHQNIACYLTSFVVGSHLWAVQPLMHYGETKSTLYTCTTCMYTCSTLIIIQVQVHVLKNTEITVKVHVHVHFSITI